MLLLFVSLVIFEMSKKFDEEFPGERHSEAGIMRLIKKIFKASGIEGVVINSRVINVFKKKISILNSKLKSAGNFGGRQAKKLLDAWKSNTYSFKIYYHELDAKKVATENQDLRSHKRKLEHDLANEEAKRLKVEEKLDKVLNQRKSDKQYYKKKFKALAKRVAKIQGNHTRLAKKKFSNYTARHKARIRNNMKQDCQATLSFLGVHNFLATKVEVYNSDEGRYEMISLVEDEELPLLGSETKELSNKDLDDLNLWIYIKDKFNISHEAWHELAMKSKDMPCKYQVCKRLHEIDKNWDLTAVPGDADGVQISFCKSLEEQITRLQNTGILNKNTKVQIKISGDGTNIGKRLKLVNITYTILNERDKAMSERGNYLLAIAKTTENYDDLKESLSNLIDEMASLKSIKVNGFCYDIEYFLGGDWKFLACVCGLGAANSNCACIWCKCPKEQRFDIKKKWSLTSKNQGARCNDDIGKCAKSRLYNCKASPLFHFIPIDHVIIDTLHLFLRVSDILVDLLIRKLRRKDAIEKTQTFANGFCYNKYKHMATYEKFLKDLGINFEWKINKDNKKLEYRDLTGPEKLKLFKNVDFELFFPDDNEKEKLRVLWLLFMEIVDDLKLDYKTDQAITNLKDKMTKWFGIFLTLYQAKDVTPYMHAMYHHVPEFLKLYGNLNMYNQQGMEKYNDIASKDYFRSSNHQGVSAIKQIFLKKQRVQHFESSGCQRVKENHHCGNCLATGHTIKTCTANCEKCGKTFCAHLVKVNGKWKPSCTLNL